ncbi:MULTISPECIES: redox-sensing transcriptional repressor Rex [Clostridiaceae]|uniref:Redox-sensing transcriptional repressor Rex n=1 Tax=Clostridium facile TaxID=2763035 RepID=A0ABR7IQM0_9CLOT|nr:MULTISPECIES: redox-sensing transcriptional repressor Rex [Clostridiaceae]MBC5787417.1 redox-sensing transcriptional repressor Rex [Clostridium facile]PWM99748.1 MAG: redox-sensing transcriptional repressor Rex [Massilioclostridium sp.]
MPKNNEVSMSVIRRLPRYYRFLGELLRTGVERVSSRELSNLMGLTASQIRQDLNCFGGFGQQGYGYNVPHLHEEISKILGLQSQQKTILIGAGNLGRAIISYSSFKGKGFELIGVFDRDPNLIGTKIANQTIIDVKEMGEFCKQNSPTVAILCVPKTSAHAIVEKLVELGIQGFWNFSHYDIMMDYPNVVAENVHLSDSLMTLSYKVTNHTKQ